MLPLGVVRQMQSKKSKGWLEKFPQHGSKESTHHWCRCKGFGFCKVERGHMHQDFRVSSLATGGMFAIALLHSFWLFTSLCCLFSCPLSSNVSQMKALSTIVSLCTKWEMPQQSLDT